MDAALADAAAGIPMAETAPELLQASMWHAARYGLRDIVIDPSGHRRRVGHVLYQLLQYIAPSLEASGDTREVTSLIHQLLKEGTRADQQRAALAEASLHGVIELVTSRSTP
ncbi:MULTISPECIES: hypothetical protein [unclassified Streptomyces]|uniref:hypothetical protein n=1 Tax=unclassified Streptomyces TaxID=2593676 RepID=UPI00403C30DA